MRTLLCDDPTQEDFFTEIGTRGEQGVTGNTSLIFSSFLKISFRKILSRGREQECKFKLKYPISLKGEKKYLTTVREYFVRSTTGRKEWPTSRVGNKRLDEKRIKLGLLCRTAAPAIGREHLACN